MGKPHRLTAKLAYQGKPFVSVPIEISPMEAGNAETHDMIESDALTLVGLPSAVAVPCMTLPWQIAQKIHAVSEPVEPPRTNDRARDLVDLQLLEALTVDEPLAETGDACRAVFDTRGKQAWPPTLATHPGWETIYLRALESLEEIGLAADVGEAIERAQNFIDRIAASRGA